MYVQVARAIPFRNFRERIRIVKRFYGKGRIEVNEDERYVYFTGYENVNVFEDGGYYDNRG